MNKEEFLQELKEALAGDVPEAVIRDNLNYYSSYLSQETSKGRSVDEIVTEIGEPFIVAKTIMESYEAGGERASGAGDGSYASYRETDTEDASREEAWNRRTQNPYPHMHYIDLNKWYWKLLGIVLLFLVMSLVFNIIGGIFALLIQFAGPLMILFLLILFIRSFRK